MKRSERVSTIDCEHVWVRSQMDPSVFRCSVCQASGHKPNNQRSRPPIYKKGVHKEKAYTIVPYGCAAKIGPPGNTGGATCGEPAYAYRGKCSIHSPLRVGEEEDS